MTLRLSGRRRSEMMPGTMANENSFLYRWSPIFLSILRIVVGLLIIEHGTQKLFHFPPSGQPASGPLPPLMMVAGWVEFGGGLLLIFGLFTRLAAFVLSGEMAVAYFMVHAAGKAIQHASPTAMEKFFPVLNKGELAVACCFVFLYIAVAGGGSWSIDSLWRRRTLAPNP